MAKVEILTFSDGRDFVNRNLVGLNEGFQKRLQAHLEADGHEVVAADIVWTSEIAATEARRLAAAGCHATIFNYTVWAFPHFSAIVAGFASKPILAFSNVNPQHPGPVAMLAAGGSLNQLGIPFDRAWLKSRIRTSMPASAGSFAQPPSCAAFVATRMDSSAGDRWGRTRQPWIPQPGNVSSGPISSTSTSGRSCGTASSSMTGELVPAARGSSPGATFITTAIA